MPATTSSMAAGSENEACTTWMCACGLRTCKSAATRWVRGRSRPTKISSAVGCCASHSRAQCSAMVEVAPMMAIFLGGIQLPIKRRERPELMPGSR